MSGKEYITKESFSRAELRIKEVGIKLGRSRTLLKGEDYSGAVESSQHCVELAIKSLLALFGLEVPRIHDPGERLDAIIKIIEQIRATTTDREMEDGPNHLIIGFTRLKVLSHLMKPLHEKSMYGYKDVPASKIFRKKDAEYFNHLAIEVSLQIAILIETIGAGLGFISEERKKSLEELFTLIKSLQDFQENK